jgi:putative transposase
MKLTEVCDILGGSRSGYHAHLRKSQRQRCTQDAVLSLNVSQAFAVSRCIYGSPSLVRCLRALGLHHGKNRIARLMREQLLQVRQKRCFVPRTTLTDKTSPVVTNHLLQRPAPSPTKYGTQTKPICSLAKAGSTSPPHPRLGHPRKPRHPTAQCCPRTCPQNPWCKPLRPVPSQRPRLPIHQYRVPQTSANVRHHRQCFGSINPATRAEAHDMVFDYIETPYNPVRIHVSLDFISTMSFEKSFSLN